MDKHRLTSLSDGIIAIIITIMLLKLDMPRSDDFTALYNKSHLFFSYILSYIYIGIYWNNHHQLFSLIQQVNIKILWLNLHLIFWLSMIPLATDWTASSNYAALPTASYAFILLMCSLAYFWLERAVLAVDQVSPTVIRLLQQDHRLTISILMYLSAIGLSFINGLLALLVLIVLAGVWFLPNQKVEQHLNSKK